MKKSIIISALLLFGAGAYAQGNLRKVPSPDSMPVQHGQTATVRMPRQTGNFWGEKPFLRPQDGVRPSKVMQVGDNTSLYGCLVSMENMSEDDSELGIYNFFAKPNTEVNALAAGSSFKSNSAVYANGKYYAFYMEEAWGWVAYVACTVYDAKTWKVEKILEPSTDWQNVPNSSALTYDEQTGKVYAVTSEDFGGPYILSTLNEEDGSFSKVASLERSYLTLAASPNGVLYGVSDDGMLYQIDKSDGSSRLVGNTNLKPHYSQSMTFDPNTGLLYWAFINDGGSALYQLNPVTAAAYKISDMPRHQEFVGLFVEKEDLSPKAPQGVSTLAFVPSVAGGTTGTVSCVAPTKATDGSSLGENVKVTICSGDEVLYEETVAPGSVVKKDNVSFSANTLYSLFATASNEAGKSPKTTTTVYIGKDVATAPSDVKLVISGKRATLTWKAPQRGVNDGYVNPDELTYKVVRNNGREDVVVAEKLADCTYSEDLPSATAKYVYSVTACTEESEGGTATSNAELSVGSYELPYSEDFSDGDACKQLFTFVDADGDGHDIYNKWYWKEDEKLMQYCSDGEHAGNDWLFTPAIHLDGKHLYNIKFSVNMGSVSNLRVTVGKSPTPEGQTEITDLKDIEESWQTDHEATFNVSGDTDYYIGFYNYSNKDCWYFNLFNISVEEGIETNVPDSVSGFDAVPSADGSNAVTLSFKAPSSLLDKTPISGAMDINIYRGEALLTKLSATAGQQVTYKDDKAPNGSNTYSVSASYGGKSGVSLSKTVWAGYDISEAVKDLKAKTTDGNMHVELTWQAPVKGVNGGYFDASKLTYRVWRSTDGKNFSPIASDLSALSYTDTAIEQLLSGSQQICYYAVTAVTPAGESESPTALVTVGKPYTFPAGESFSGGYLDLSPWSFKSLAGELGWQTIRSDKSGGGWPQDNDGGFLKFANNWGDMCVDSRLITPVISMQNTTSPTFSFYMFHWLTSSVSSDNKQTKLMIEVAADGGDFDEPLATFTAADDNGYGWAEHRVSLEKYKDCKYIQVALRGYIENNWMYYYVDNIHFDEQYANDLAVTGFSGPSDALINDTCHYSLTYSNRGLESAAGYTILLKQDGETVATAEGGEIAPGESRSADLEATILPTKAGSLPVFTAEISYDKDADKTNNLSAEVETSVKESPYPVVTTLTATRNGAAGDLKWEAPQLPSADAATVDGFEDYVPFEISGFGDWVSYDGDGLGSGKINSLPDFENQNANKAFQVWRPTALQGVNAETYPDLMPYSGDNCLIAWYANVSVDGANPQNDDYLISPEVKGGTELSFYIKKINRNTSGETYQIMYSTTTQDPSAFVSLKDDEAPADWTKVSATLPADAKYFAIHYTAKLKNAIMVDDISYVPVLYALSVEGYNVFRNGKKVNAGTIAQTSYRDAGIGEERQAYQVSVVYNRGESNASRAVYLEPATGIESVAALNSDSYTVYTLDGRLVGKGLRRAPKLAPGTYVINGRKVVIGK